MYGCTEPAWMGPGRISATSITMSEKQRGRSRGRVAICARDSTWNTPTVSAAHSRSYTPGSSCGRECSPSCTPSCSPTSSNATCRAVSIPSPSRSNLTKPASAQSSLSHCSTVRPGIRAHSTGHTSITGRSHITMPPEWMPRWRGSRRNRSARSRTASGISPRSDAAGGSWAGTTSRPSSLSSSGPTGPARCTVHHGLGLSGPWWTVQRAGPVGPLLLSEDGRDVVPAQLPPAASDLGEIPDAVLDLADRFLRLPRHLGIHSGGMVMCDRPVIEVCPVEWARMPGRTVLQWDKEDCADAGLVKFDLLGLGMLTALQVAFELVGEHEGVQLGLHSLPQEDPGVYDLLCAADTVGVFQVESRAQMATLPRLRPRCFYDIVIEVALIRPGPIQGGSVHPYINRVRGREPVTHPVDVRVHRPALD